MNRTGWKYLLVGAVVVFALWATAPQADAYWWGCCRPVGYCYSPCYTSYCGTGCYDGGWYLGYRRGPIRRLLLGPCRWYWNGCGYSYTSCYSSCGYGGCTTCDSCTSNATMPAQPGQPTPAKKPVPEPPAAMPTEPAPAPAQPLPTPKTSATSADTSGILTVWVPFNAKVTINGLATKSTGSRREFVSHGLKPGMNYKYVVKAQVVRDGKMLEDTQTVTLTAGQIEAVAFGFNTQPTEQVAAR